MPLTVGWSGTNLKKLSRLFLKVSTLSEFKFLSVTGRILKSWAPLTPREHSLAFLTEAGELFTILLGKIVRPLRSELQKVTS